MTEHRFVLLIAFEIWKSFRYQFGQAIQDAKSAYRDFLKDEGISFGHADYSWDVSGAKDIAHEYIVRFGEVAA